LNGITSGIGSVRTDLKGKPAFVLLPQKLIYFYRARLEAEEKRPI